MKNFWIYLAVVLATVYVEIMYDGFDGTYLLAFELLLLVVLFLLSRYLKKKVSMEIRVPIPAVQKEQEVHLEILAENQGWLPVTRVRFRVKAENLFSGKKEWEPMQATIPARGRTMIPCQLASSYCGRICISVYKAKVWDYMGLFAWRIPCLEKQFINVLPDFYEMEVAVTEKTRNFSMEGEEYDPHRSGDDPSEIFGIREFRNGDSFQRIHWKMSAKSDEWMIRELGRPISLAVCFLVELYQEEQMSLKQIDAVIECTAAVCYSLWRAGVPHCVVWFDEEKGTLIRKIIRREEQVYEMVDEFLGIRPYIQHRDLKKLYQEEHPGEGFSTELYLDSHLGLLSNGEERARFDMDRLREQLLEYRLEV